MTSEPMNGKGAASTQPEVVDVPVQHVTETVEPTPSEPKPEPQIDWKDRFVRLAADFDNYKKREEREAKLLRRRVESQVLSRWLEVVDTTDAALIAAEGKEGAFFDGLRGIARQMQALLKAAKVNKMEVEGASFDPRLHEALATMPTDPQRDNTVIHVERSGYVYEDGEILRPARVVVGKSTS